MGWGSETAETTILEIGAGMLVLGLAFITGGLVGALLLRRQYGAVLPLGLILAAVALLLWWAPVIRVVVSFPLLLLGYAWLLAWWRGSQQEHAQVLSHRWRSRHRGTRSPGWRGRWQARRACRWAAAPERSPEGAKETRVG